MAAPRTSVKSPQVPEGSAVECFKDALLRHLTLTLAKHPDSATPRDWWVCTCMVVRDHVLENLVKTQKRYADQDVRCVYYLSLEYMMGRLLINNLNNVNLYGIAKEALELLQVDSEQIFEEEEDMGLGNGGLGRLAACFLDSLATLDYPAVGYGIHYEFGLFRQEFLGGRQVEHPDNWVQFGNPWQIRRTDHSQEISIYGHLEQHFNDAGDSTSKWMNAQTIVGIPWDVPIVGYGTSTVNFLRLWEARGSEEFNFGIFNEGGYVEAVREKVLGESISKVLYPNDQTESGKELRLVQQYFFAACSLKDIIASYQKSHEGWDAFPQKVTIQLNDTHPTIAIVELMRILMDEYDFNWADAWSLCQKVFNYTNHTLLPEALEKWSVGLLEKVLPRHLEIIYELNAQLLEEVSRKWPQDFGKQAALSLIEEGYPKMVRMAYLGVWASQRVNGVAKLHTELLEKHLFHDFYELFSEKFTNKTNGITPRRWLDACNPDLARLITESIGEEWATDLTLLKKLEPFAEKGEFREKYYQIKRQNKKRLVQEIAKHCGVDVSEKAIFDVQVKRIHEYKRQHLNLLYILTLYRRLLHDPKLDVAPRVFIFGGKAAPGYLLAKNIIHAINAVGRIINSDERVQGRIKVAFLPNYSVSLAEKIIPAADVSEQISTAGKEASGTGNMKLALNGALTLGTLDGANVEIRDAVGDENIFIFGKTVEEVEALRSEGYDPYHYYEQSEELRAVLDWLGSDHFTPGEGNALAPLRDSLLSGGDPFMVLADYEAYCQAQERVDHLYRNREEWLKKAILNTARMGWFSSDRTIREYADDVWQLKPTASI